jgi:hypothetical protein
MKTLLVNITDSTVDFRKITPEIKKALEDEGAVVSESETRKGKAKIDFGEVNLGTVPEGKAEITDWKAVIANNESAVRVSRRATFVNEKLSKIGLVSSAKAETRIKTADALVSKGMFETRELALAFLTENGL